MPLWWATAQGDIPAVQNLLGNGARPHCWRPIRNQDTTAKLLTVGAHVDIQRERYPNTIQAVSAGGHEILMQIPVDAGTHY